MEEEQSENYRDITIILNNFKVPSNIMGFEYIRSAVLACLEDEALTESITKCIYPYLSKLYDTNIQHIERNIRNAVDRSFELKGMLALNEYCGMVVCNNEHKFTNGEMVFTVLEIMKIRRLKRINQQELELESVETAEELA